MPSRGCPLSRARRWANAAAPPSAEEVDQLYGTLRGYWEFMWDWERRARWALERGHSPAFQTPPLRKEVVESALTPALSAPLHRRRMCPPAFAIEDQYSGGMALGIDPAAEWDGQGPRPRKLVPGTLGCKGVGAGPIGKTSFTAGMNYHARPDGQVDQEARIRGQVFF